MKSFYEEVLDIFYKNANKEEINRVMYKETNCVDYDIEFMGFLEQYYCLSKVIPKDWFIIDFGCAAAFQSVFFENHKGYLGIDITVSSDARYKTKNSSHLKCSIEEYISKKLYEKFDLNKTFAICNYVPSNIAKKQIRKIFPNLFVYYPN